MRGALIETSARTILNQGISQNQKETALRQCKMGADIYCPQYSTQCWKTDCSWTVSDDSSGVFCILIYRKFHNLNRILIMPFI